MATSDVTKEDEHTAQKFVFSDLRNYSILLGDAQFHFLFLATD
jgi:hypothetical protein